MQSDELTASRMPRNTSPSRSASMPNCCEPPPIAIPEPCERKSGSPVAQYARTARYPTEFAELRQLARGLEIDHHSGGHRRRELMVLLPGPGDADVMGRHAGAQSYVQLAQACHVQAVDQRHDPLDELRQRLALIA